ASFVTAANLHTTTLSAQALIDKGLATLQELINAGLVPAAGTGASPVNLSTLFQTFLGSPARSITLANLVDKGLLTHADFNALSSQNLGQLLDAGCVALTDLVAKGYVTAANLANTALAD